jgi:transcriptional regulator with XRE-family HTH domain
VSNDLPEWVRQQRWDLGRRARALRRERDLTQEQLAARVGVDSKTISRVENGHFNIGVDLIGALARGLGVPAWRLFRDE